MRAKRLSTAFLTVSMLHVVIAAMISIYFMTQTQQFKSICVDVLTAKEWPKAQVRGGFSKPVIKPTIPRKNAIVAKQVQVQPRVMTMAVVRTTSVQPQTVLAFSSKNCGTLGGFIPLNVPKVASPSAPLPQDATYAELPLSHAPDALAFSTPVVSAPTGRLAIIHRGVGDIVKLKTDFGRPAGLSMLQHVGVARDALANVVEDITLGNVDVPPLLRGEPGGRVIGRDRNIRGVFRFTRIRHALSDWWADPSSLNFLTAWLNERTKIKTDMNVAGGAIKLTDANLMKSPLVFMTGHDPAFVRARNLMGRQYAGGKLDNRLTEAEAAALRKYLVEKGGFLIFDDCGVNAPAQAMVRLFLAQMRYVMPAYQIGRIPNDHEIYNNFYEMGGPPLGFDIFWWGARPPKRNFLEGISVGEKLSVLIVRRDYLCAMRTVGLPGFEAYYSPGVYRFMTNVVVYALTHGSIGDYSGYIPGDCLTQHDLPKRAPQAAKIGAIE